MRPRPRQDPHAILGVAPGATRAEIRRAYRRRAKAVHPDVAGATATATMAELNEARDQLLARPSSGPGPAAPDSPASTPPPEPPEWSRAHESAWADHWSAWNELPRRP